MWINYFISFISINKVIINVWNFLVNQKLIGSAASDLGLTITPEELKELQTGSINSRNISQFFRNSLGENFNLVLLLD